MEISGAYYHYLIKLHLDEDTGYNREKVEYCYYLAAVHAGIKMMPSKMIDNKYFATLRFDRQNGEKFITVQLEGLVDGILKTPLYLATKTFLSSLCASKYHIKK